MNIAATLHSAMKPGDPQWVKTMTASKIGAVIGKSPYDSPFSLWHKMAGSVPWEVDNDTLRRGHYLEPALRQWFRDQHPTLQVDPNKGTWVNNDRPWQAASPDGLALTRSVKREVVALVQCKTSLLDWEWGEPLTDEIPPGYRAQVMWEMDTLGIDRCHLSVLTSSLEFREYVVDYDPDEAQGLREAAQAFLRSIELGRPPALDGHDETYQAVRHLHADIDDVKVEVSPAIVHDLVVALLDRDDAEERRRTAITAIAARMGNARHATCADRIIATRQSRKDGIPYLVTARGLAAQALERTAS